MCQIGDIVLIKRCKIGEQNIGRHSFVVMSTDEGEIEGVPFDLVCNIMSSLDGKGEEYRKRKAQYPENFFYSPTEENVINGHGKEGFIKAGIYFLFNRKDLDYEVIGNINTSLYLRLCKYIQGMNPEDIRYITDNLKQADEESGEN